MTAFQKLVQENAELLKRMVQNPFVEGLAQGTLPREAFLFYLRQDYVYLLEYTRALSLALARMDSEAERAWFARLVHETLNFEMDLHRRTCDQAGIPRQDLEKTEPTLTTQLYTAYLIRLATLAPVEELIAGLLPCEWGYYFVASEIGARVLPKDPFYRDWIETYRSEAFKALGDALIEMFHRRVPTEEHLTPGIRRAFRTSLRLENLFFLMAWHRGDPFQEEATP